MHLVTDTSQMPILRGKILLICNGLAQTGANVELMQMFLEMENFSCTQFDIEAACYYLNDKKLIQFKDTVPGEFNIETDYAYITAEGIDVLEALDALDTSTGDALT